MTKVLVLGSGCSKCGLLERRLLALKAAHRLDIEIIKVTDFEEMISFGIMMTPGLVIDGIVKSVGNVPKDEQLLEWLT